MGGHLAGDRAAEMVIEGLPALLRRHPGGTFDLAGPDAAPGVIAALTELSDRVRSLSEGRPGLDGMGSTVVLALVRGTHVVIAHLGDSRAYLVRGQGLARITRDHTIVQLLVDNGEIDPEEAPTHSARGQLTRYVGMAGEALPEARCLEIQEGDRILLCSDGLTGVVNEERLLSALRAGKAPSGACRRLVDAANAAGGKDNVTAVVLLVSGRSD